MPFARAEQRPDFREGLSMSSVAGLLGLASRSGGRARAARNEEEGPF